MVKYDPSRHHRRSIRWKGYDYSQAGAYFVTICTQHRECLFGAIVDGQMQANDAGKMIQTIWDEIPTHYPGVDIDEFVVMPNHIHGIIMIVPPDPVGAGPGAHVGAGPRAHVGAGPRACPIYNTGQPQGVAPTLSLPDVVHRFKTMTTKRYIDGVKHHGWRRFSGKLWQRNYWEHVVRNENELNRICKYIRDNPTQWGLDKLCPDQPHNTGTPQEMTVCEPIARYGQSACHPSYEVWMI